MALGYSGDFSLLLLFDFPSFSNLCKTSASCEPQDEGGETAAWSPWQQMQILILGESRGLSSTGHSHCLPEVGLSLGSGLGTVSSILPKPNTPWKIKDSCSVSLRQHFLFIINHEGTCHFLKHGPRWCNFMMVHIFCVSAELIYPQVVAAEEKLVPPHWIMITLETLKTWWAASVSCSFVEFGDCCFSFCVT